MKALVWTAPEHMEMHEVEMPRPQPGELLVKVKVAGICGSEIEGYLGHNSLRIPPLIMGHEFSGVVEQCGEQADRFHAGQNVTVNPLIACGRCDRCRNGKPNLCDTRSIIGIHRPGAFAEYVCVPESSACLLPEDMDLFSASLTEPLACSLRAARRALEHHPLANVVVIGAGAIGLLSAMAAKILGASKVIVMDTNPERLERAAACCADGTVNPRTEDVPLRTKEIEGQRGVDVVIDAAGFQPTRELAVRLLNPGGTLMNIGLGIDATTLPVNVLIRSEIALLSSFCYDRQDFYEALQLLASGKVSYRGWTEVRDLSEGNRAFADLVSAKVVNGKIFLTPGA